MKTTHLHPDPADAASATGGTSPAATGHARGTRDSVGDQALGFLSTLETQLSQLKKSAEETALRAADLQAQQESL
ncbi:MAG: hypothetical protein ACK5XO_14835, partial [Phycisphaerales bacterium]